MFEAVVFDWDETLADTKKEVVASFQTTLKQVGCNVSDEFIEKRIGIGARNTFKEALQAAKMPFTDEALSGLVERKVNAQLQLTGTVRLFEGTLDLLESLYGRIRIALASMNNRKVIDKLLTEKRLTEYFTAVITADEVTKPKPDPEIYINCAVKLKCNPRRCVVLEDSIFGVRAAKAAGMKCIGVTTGAYDREELEKENVDIVVDSLGENERILGFILDGT
jgi:beta-phosphoglucomutase